MLTRLFCPSAIEQSGTTPDASPFRMRSDAANNNVFKERGRPVTEYALASDWRTTTPVDVLAMQKLRYLLVVDGTAAIAPNPLKTALIYAKPLAGITTNKEAVYRQGA